MSERPKIYIGEGLKKAYASFKSPVVLRSEYESLRQEFIETMQFLANHSQMTENLKDYCNRTLSLLEENDDRIT